MFKLLKKYTLKRKATIKIQTINRGILARNRFKIKRAVEINKKNLQYFSNQAIVIQKTFRGYHKRKYIHDFRARK